MQHLLFSSTLLSPMLAVLCVVGIIESIWLMQALWAMDPSGRQSAMSRYTRRVAFAMIAFCMVWVLYFAQELYSDGALAAVAGLIFGIDLAMAVRIYALRRLVSDDVLKVVEPSFNQVVANLAGATFIIIFLGLVVLVLDRQPPYSRSSGRIVPENPRAGDFVEIEWTGTASRLCPGVVHRAIIDSRGRLHDLGTFAAVYGERRPSINLVRQFQIPANLPAGPASYQATTEFVCNPTHKLFPIVISGPPVTFNVAK